MDFHSLPEDIVLRILLSCDVDILFTCKLVSRHFRDLIDGDIYLQYKIELVINGMVDGPESCDMTIVERLQHLRDYCARYHSSQFANSGFEYSWQLRPAISTMPTTGWEAHQGFGGSISYIVVKPPQREISICAPPRVSGPREMRNWVVPFEAVSKRPDLVTTSVSADLSQDLLLVAVQEEDSGRLSILLRSLNNTNNVQARALQPTLAVVMSDQLESSGRVAPGPSILGVYSIQIHKNLVAWRLFIKSRPTSSCDIEVWDWRTGQRLWHSHYTFSTSFTLLDNAHVVTVGLGHEELIVERFAQRTPGVEAGPVLVLGLPPQRGFVRIQESSIPTPPSPAEPFWTDPALRIIVVKLSRDSALFVPCGAFFEALSTIRLATEKSPSPKEVTRITWEDWQSQALLLVSSVPKGRLREEWSFAHCHAYGPRVVVHTFDLSATTFDLNPWAERNARRFAPANCTEGDNNVKDPRVVFGIKDAALPHAALSRSYVGSAFAQSTPGLAADIAGFTQVVSAVRTSNSKALPAD